MIEGETQESRIAEIASMSYMQERGTTDGGEPKEHQMLTMML